VMEKLLLRPEEAAELISVGRSKMYALLAAGDLPSIRVGHSVRVPVRALQAWVDDQTHLVTDGAPGEGEAE